MPELPADAGPPERLWRGRQALLESNTQLTQQEKELTEKIEALTREIHARLTGVQT
jgi:hypothetical protein